MGAERDDVLILEYLLLIRQWGVGAAEAEAYKAEHTDDAEFMRRARFADSFFRAKPELVSRSLQSKVT